jgi:hypothetical protein
MAGLGACALSWSEVGKKGQGQVRRAEQARGSMGHLPPAARASRPLSNDLTRPLPPSSTDNIAPALGINTARVNGEIASGAATGKPADWPVLTAQDTVFGYNPSLTTPCKAAIGGTPMEVTAATSDFPRGPNVVTCTAKDAAGNESPRVAFVVMMGCVSGHIYRGGKCEGE